MRDQRPCSLLTPGPRGRKPPERLPLTAAQHALIAQFRPMAHWVRRRKFGWLTSRIGEEEASAWTEWFLCEAAQRFDPNRVSPVTGKPISFGTMLTRWVWGRLAYLSRKERLDPAALALHASQIDDGGNKDFLSSALFSRDPAQQSVDDAEAKRHRRGLCARLLARLDWRSRFVVEARHGLLDGREWTLNAISKALGLSKERVRQIELAAMRAVGERAEKLKGKGVTCD